MPLIDTSGCSKALIILLIIIILCFVGFKSCNYLNSYERFEKKIDNALVKKDFREAHKWLKRFEDKNKNSWHKEDDDYKYYYSKVFNAEVTYLLYENTIEASDRIVQLIADYGFYGSPVVGVTKVKKIIKNNEEYTLEAAKYNQMLDGVLNRAIAVHNQYLAAKVLDMYKPTLKKSLHDTHTFSSDEYDFEYSDEQKERAKETYNKAIKEKKF